MDKASLSCLSEIVRFLTGATAVTEVYFMQSLRDFIQGFHSMTKPSKISVRKQRSVYTYSELWHASNCVLESGLQNDKGSSWQFLSSIVLTAFSFEAYLNHVGPRALSSWSELERSSVWAKFMLLSEVLGVEFPGGLSTPPLQTVAQLLAFRNTMAHGRSEELETEEVIDHHPDMDPFATSPLTKWEKRLEDPKFAQQARKAVETVLQKLHTARKDPKEPLFSFGMGHHSARALPPDTVTIPPM